MTKTFIIELNEKIEKTNSRVMIAIANERFWKKAEKLKNRQVLENILAAIENVEAA